MFNITDTTTTTPATPVTETIFKVTKLDHYTCDDVTLYMIEKIEGKEVESYTFAVQGSLNHIEDYPPCDLFNYISNCKNGRSWKYITASLYPETLEIEKIDWHTIDLECLSWYKTLDFLNDVLVDEYKPYNMGGPGVKRLLVEMPINISETSNIDDTADMISDILAKSVYLSKVNGNRIQNTAELTNENPEFNTAAFKEFHNSFLNKIDKNMFTGII